MVISEQDLSFYRSLGYEDSPGVLIEVPAERELKFPNWEALSAPSSPWFTHLPNPSEECAYWVRLNLISQDQMNAWTIRKEKPREEIRKNIKQADGFQVRGFQGEIHPSKTYLELITDGSNADPKYYQIGEVLAALKPTRDRLLSIVNSNPLGRNGGFQQVATLVHKPIFVEMPRYPDGVITAEYHPSL
ncbi:MAG TPA: hypothetical protein VHE53_05645 [Patescibacteria group bacterium]|nr:hypothetical protein [Patescibacteria group bacterium]